MKNNINNTSEQNSNIQEQFFKYLFHWKWFLLSVFIGLFLAYTNLRYSIPTYQVTATILIKDDKKGGGLATEISTFSDLGFGVKSNVDNEVEVLKSRKLVEKSITNLGLNVTYYQEGLVKTSESYKKLPVKVNFFNSSPLFFKKGGFFTLKPISISQFELYTKDKSLIGKFSYGELIKNELGSMIFTNSYSNLNNLDKNLINIEITPLEYVTNSYKNRLEIAPINKLTSVITLSIIDPIKERGVDFINKIIQNYNEDAVSDNNIVAKKTLLFLNQRIDSLNIELDSVESSAEQYKKKEKITNIVFEAEQFVASSGEYDVNLVKVNTEIKVIDYMINFVTKKPLIDVIPINIIPEQSDAGSLIIEYNKLIATRAKLFKRNSDVNPAIVNLDHQLDEIRTSILESLKNLKATLNIRQLDLSSQGNILGGKIKEIPRQEREYRVIDRQQKVKEQLYLYLLQKKEENAISLAVSSANSKIIDGAYANPNAVSPKKQIVYLIGLFFGLLIPFLIIYFIDLSDNKIKTRFDVESRTTIPFIGDIPRAESSSQLIEAFSRSNTSESFRIIRTNLDFIVSNVLDGIAKTIFVTSTFPKEGKTFVSVNLAGTFALSGKKVLLMGMDIRNPKLDQYMTLPNKGLTSYISDNNTDLNDLIVKLDGYDGFYVLPAGIIPPNPAELLMNEKVDLMFTILKKQFDYIIVDTAPISLVTDTMLVAKYADSFIYVARANVLDKSMLKFPQSLYEENRLPNMSILLNDSNLSSSYYKYYGYGYGYGYGYYGYGYGYGYGVDVKVEKKWYEKALNFFRKRNV